jgi:rubrerythrin
MQMSNTDQSQKSLNHLLDQIIMVRDLYAYAAKKIHDEPLQKMLDGFSRHKDIHLKDIKSSFQLDNGSLKFSQLVNLSKDKLGMDIDDFFIRRNEKEVLSFCIKRERELVELYQQIINDHQFSDFEMVILKNQLKEVKSMISESQSIYEKYDFGN